MATVESHSIKKVEKHVFILEMGPDFSEEFFLFFENLSQVIQETKKDSSLDNKLLLIIIVTVEGVFVIDLSQIGNGNLVLFHFNLRNISRF